MPVRDPSVSEVRSELRSVLASRGFRQSRSLAKLLRYICSRALVDDAGAITEYTIAVDVFGKAPDFKESKDASVRVEVHRLRKRLAEYYEAEGAEHQVQIVIPTGQYVPHFIATRSGMSEDEPRPEEVPVAAEETEDAPVIAEALSAPVPVPDFERPAIVLARNGRRWTGFIQPLRYRILAAVLAVTAVVSAVLYFGRSDSLDSFWHPVFLSNSPILLCVGNLEGGQRPEPEINPSSGITVRDFHHLASEMMLVQDATTLSRFAGLLQEKGKRFRVVTQSEATFSDLQSTPAVLIGLANNDWTERLVGKLRFRLERRLPAKLILRDRDNPSREWATDYTAPYLSLTRDYAVVVRVLDPKTEQMVVTAAGLSSLGTLAAGEFLTNPQEFQKIEAIAPKKWQKMNFELVLSTDVIRGKSGHPAIVAAHFW